MGTRTLAAAGAIVAVLAGVAAPAAAAGSDDSALAAALQSVLETRKTGSTHTWYNPGTGTSGSIVITRTYYTPDRQPCRDYRATVGDRRIDGTGCRAAGGTWVLSEHGRAPKLEARPRGTTAPPAVDVGAGDVRQAQRLLNALGYDAGPVDGVAGERTRDAVRSYQSLNGLPVTGRIDDRLLAALSRDAGRGAVRRGGGAAASVESWASAGGPRLEKAAGRPLDARGVYARVNGSVWVVVAGSGRTRSGEAGGDVSLGSAVAVDDTHLLTNCHIVEGHPALDLVQGGDTRRARVVATDAEADRCVLAVAEGGLQPVPGVRPFNDLAVGEAVYTVGTPSGLERTLGEGIISGLREIRGERYVQTTAQISRGSSGGGLFDAHGNLIGITTGYLKSGQSLNFAIAAEDYWR